MLASVALSHGVIGMFLWAEDSEQLDFCVAYPEPSCKSISDSVQEGAVVDICVYLCGSC